MSKDIIRIVVCGDNNVGKSSLIISLVKGCFIPNIQNVLPQVTIPKDFSSNPYSPNSTILIDTDNQDPQQLQRVLKNADAILLVYSDNESYERLSQYWILTFRSFGLNLPIIVCKNKCDTNTQEDFQRIEDVEFLPLLANFKEVEICIQTSVKSQMNINHVFYLCQRAIVHPITPLLDSKTSELKINAIKALERVFYLSDNDQDGYLNDIEIIKLQKKCFNKKIDINELSYLREQLSALSNFDPLLTTYNDNNTIDTDTIHQYYVPGKGITKDGFLLLNKLYAQQGRHETTWAILRAFNYTNSLSIDDKILSLKLNIPKTASVELGSKGYRFLVNLFLKFDKDNDGGLNNEELAALFKTTPGIPKFWSLLNFPFSTVVNTNSCITLQGWLAQWSMTTFLNYRITTEYLIYFGYEEDALSALQVTKTRKTRRRSGKLYRAPINDRTVFNCFIIGKAYCGKTSILESFLGRTFSDIYSPTIQPRIAVNSLELKGGQQCYLILQELGEQENAVLENKEKLNECDVLCLLYDSSDPESFSYLVEMLNNHKHLKQVPILFVACKADLDKQQQRYSIQPDDFAEQLSVDHPLHVSSLWPTSLNELFVTIAELAHTPFKGTVDLPKNKENASILDDSQRWMLMGSVVGVVAIFSFTLAKFMQARER